MLHICTHIYTSLQSENFAARIIIATYHLCHVYHTELDLFVDLSLHKLNLLRRMKHLLIHVSRVDLVLGVSLLPNFKYSTFYNTMPKIF